MQLLRNGDYWVTFVVTKNNEYVSVLNFIFRFDYLNGDQGDGFHN